MNEGKQHAHTDNVDSAEIAKFNALAQRWWDPKGDFRPLHDMNPLRMNYIQAQVDIVNKQVLDVGCGGGLLAEGLAVRGAHVTGIDMSEQAIAVAREHLALTRKEQDTLNLNYHLDHIEQWQQNHREHYDVITCLELLEHVPDPEQTLLACAQALKPGGHLFVSTINRNPKSYLLAILGAEYILKLLPKGTHQYKNFIQPSELDAWLRGAQLDLQELKGMHYNPFTHAFKLTDNVSVNYLMHIKKAG